MRRPHAHLLRHLRTRYLLVALLLSVCSVVTAPPAAAAQTIGFPTFSGPAIPAPPVAYTPGDMMRSIYDAESSGPTSGWTVSSPAPATTRPAPG